jgi:hypothetical protein
METPSEKILNAVIDFWAFSEVLPGAVLHLESLHLLIIAQ